MEVYNAARLLNLCRGRRHVRSRPDVRHLSFGPGCAWRAETGQLVLCGGPDSRHFFGLGAAALRLVSAATLFERSRFHRCPRAGQTTARKRFFHIQ
jgi:hypothetical protein